MTVIAQRAVAYPQTQLSCHTDAEHLSLVIARLLPLGVDEGAIMLSGIFPASLPCFPRQSYVFQRWFVSPSNPMFTPILAVSDVGPVQVYLSFFGAGVLWR
jgi:hypothetical protein